MKHPSYCSFPFESIAPKSWLDGKPHRITPCCNMKTDVEDPMGVQPLVDQGAGLHDIFMSEQFTELRKDLLSGIRNPACDYCWRMEKRTGASPRITAIEHLTASKVQATPKLKKLDTMIDESCNLRCRMCQSQNSSAIYKELKDEELYNEEERKFIVETSHWGDFSDYTQPWFDDPGFLSTVETWLPNVNRLYFTGGEPTIIQRVYWILEKCVELGINQNIDLVFNSNMTNIQPRFLDLIAKFKDVLMCLSVDGYGTTNEYIRSGSTWSIVDKHIRDYAKSDVVGNILFSPVVQIYNILDITKLLDYAEEITNESGRRIDISFLLNNYPKCLDIRNLPKGIRVEAQLTLHEWLQNSTYFDDDERNRQSVLGLINALDDKNVNEDAEHQMQVFRKYTELLDNKRNQSIEKQLPKLWSRLKWT